MRRDTGLMRRSRGSLSGHQAGNEGGVRTQKQSERDAGRKRRRKMEKFTDGLHWEGGRLKEVQINLCELGGLVTLLGEITEHPAKL